MKNILIISLLASLLYGCKSPCGKECGVNQVCVDSQCQCRLYFEGADCQTRMRDKFLGTYVGTLYSKKDTSSYQITLFTDSTDKDSNSHIKGSNNPYSMSVTSSREFFIAYLANDGIYSGTGSLAADSKTLTLNYEVVVPKPNPDTFLYYTFIGSK